MDSSDTQAPSATSPLAKLAGGVIYTYFFAVFLAWHCWWGIPDLPGCLLPAASKLWKDWAAPIPFYAAPPAPAIDALVRDLMLVLAFSVPHSLLSMPAVKKAMGLPHAFERPFFVLQAALLLHAQMRLWLPVDGPMLWDARGTPLGSTLQASFYAGFIWLLSSTFALDHFELFGLSQSFGTDINLKLGLAPRRDSSGLAVRAHYALVAHPIMTGLFIVLWSAPVMSASRLLLASTLSLYIVLAVKLLEEPRLCHYFGKPYIDYLETVPTFCPMMPKSRPAKAVSNSKKKAA
jgi:protein-S-isoprenylcysteine O-methyltransferase Ste14